MHEINDLLASFNHSRQQIRDLRRVTQLDHALVTFIRNAPEVNYSQSCDIQHESLLSNPRILRFVRTSSASLSDIQYLNLATEPFVTATADGPPELATDSMNAYNALYAPEIAAMDGAVDDRNEYFGAHQDTYQYCRLESPYRFTDLDGEYEGDCEKD